MPMILDEDVSFHLGNETAWIQNEKQIIQFIRKKPISW